MIFSPRRVVVFKFRAECSYCKLCYDWTTVLSRLLHAWYIFVLFYVIMQGALSNNSGIDRHEVFHGVFGSLRSNAGSSARRARAASCTRSGPTIGRLGFPRSDVIW